MPSANVTPSETYRRYREYLKERPTYDQLCEEAKTKVRALLEWRGIPFASVSTRVKSFPSLSVKLAGKKVRHGHLMKALKDTAGVRIVVWKNRDRLLISQRIHEIFDVLPGAKEAALSPDVATYNDDKYYCTLLKTPSLVPALRGLVFELQVQTAMINAWAAVGHDVYYKASPQLPNEYRKRFELLVSLANLADDNTDVLTRDVEALALQLSLHQLNVIGLKAHLDKVTDEVDPHHAQVANTFTDPADARLLVEDLAKCEVLSMDQLKNLVNRSTVRRCLIAANGQYLDYSWLVRLILMMERIDLYFGKAAHEILILDQNQLPILKALKIDYKKAARAVNKPIYVSDGKRIRVLTNR